MARSRHKLSDASVKAEKLSGRHSDGGGLYLNVSATGTKSWVFLWTRDGRRREMGLGGYPLVTLAKARQKAANSRLAVEEGRDPIAEKSMEAEPTFGECADRYIVSIKSEWRNAKHEYQWNQTLTSYCYAIRGKRVSQINTDDVLSVLTPIWISKAETASRLRGRIERVLDFAKAKGWRTGENPALWRGHLRNVLPKRQKLQRGHLKAMPYAEVPTFLARLHESQAMAARALEFVILTVGRSNEVLGARWTEIDFDNAKWTVPANRMKLGVQHVIPLSRAGIALLRSLEPGRINAFIFPGEYQGGRRIPPEGKPLSGMSMEMLLRRMKVHDATVHGFRSSFRDWAGDVTTFPREVAEAALAHRVGDEVERAYRRSDALEKRRKLMQAWADYLAAPKAGAANGNVLPMRKRYQTRRDRPASR